MKSRKGGLDRVSTLRYSRTGTKGLTNILNGLERKRTILGKLDTEQRNEMKPDTIKSLGESQRSDDKEKQPDEEEEFENAILNDVKVVSMS